MLSEAKSRLNDLSSKQKLLLDELDPARESKLLDFYVRLIPRVLTAERCSVFIHEPATDKVWLKSGTGVAERGIEVSLKDSIVGEVIASGKTVIADDLAGRNGAHRQIDVSTGFTTREVICVPIRSTDKSRVTGAIQVLNKSNGSGFDEADQAFLEEVGDHFQSIVENIYLSQEAVNISRNLVATTARAVTFGFIAVAASFFVSVFVTIYGGFPLWFA